MPLLVSMVRPVHVLCWAMEAFSQYCSRACRIMFHTHVVFVGTHSSSPLPVCLRHSVASLYSPIQDESSSTACHCHCFPLCVTSPRISPTPPSNPVESFRLAYNSHMSMSVTFNFGCALVGWRITGRGTSCFAMHTFHIQCRTSPSFKTPSWVRFSPPLPV